MMVFFFNDTATPEIYTLSLHDALPIWGPGVTPQPHPSSAWKQPPLTVPQGTPGTHRTCRRTERRGLTDRKRPRCASQPDRKSTRLNSSHANISYAVFCLKKKKRTLCTD